jgi:hypothetical protein
MTTPMVVIKLYSSRLSRKLLHLVPTVQGTEKEQLVSDVVALWGGVTPPQRFICPGTSASMLFTLSMRALLTRTPHRSEQRRASEWRVEGNHDSREQRH